MTVQAAAGAPHFPSGASVSPSIFDAQVRPDLVQPLVLANLLAPSLWSLAQRVQVHAAQAPLEAEAGALPAVLRHAQQRMDRWFEHLSPLRTAELFGHLDLEAEAARLGPQAVERTAQRLCQNLRERVQEGTLDPQVLQALEQDLAQGRFPAYHYAHCDVVQANRRLLRERRRVPQGLTSCLDEAALFAALAMALPAGTVDWVVVLAAPEHTTAFGHSTPGGPWWFYGKGALMDAPTWRREVQAGGGDAQAAFARRLGAMDRIVSIDGRFDLASGHCEIPGPLLQEIVQSLDDFFGARLAVLQQGLDRRQDAPPSPLAACFRELLGARSLEAVRERLAGQGAGRAGSPLLPVLHAFRSLEVDDLGPYLQAARGCSHATARRAAQLASVDEALQLVAGLPGRESLFGDRERLAMPDETLRLGTGTERDRALLLQLLLEHLPLAQRPAAVRARIGADHAFVEAGARCIDLHTFTDTDPQRARLLAPRCL